MSTPVDNLGVPKVSDGTEDWMDFITTVTKCYNKIPKEIGAGYYEMYGRSVLMCRKPEYVDKILKNHTAHYLWGGIADASTCFFGDKVMFVVEDAEWRKLRKVMSPELRSKIDVPKFIQDMTVSATGLSGKLEAQVGQTVDLIAAVRAFHLSSAGRSMFNVNLQCVETYPKGNKITDAFSYFLAELPRRSFSQDPVVCKDYTTENEDNKGMWKARDAVHDVILEVVRDRMRGKNSNRNDMLRQMMDAFKAEHGKSVSAKEIESALGANLVELLFAGYNTVVNTICTAIYLLYTNEDKLAKAREELDRVLGNNLMTEKDMDNLKYLTCVFKETLRMYPPAPAIARRLGKDEKLGDFTIPQDAEVMFSMAGVHMDPENWKDPEKFMPERFQYNIKAGTFIPFSDGPRSCIGQHFARFEFLTFMSLVLREYEFAPVSDYKFGMMFNGFGWMACDMSDMWAGSKLKMKIAKKNKVAIKPASSGPSPLLIGLGVAVAGLAFWYKSRA